MMGIIVCWLLLGLISVSGQPGGSTGGSTGGSSGGSTSGSTGGATENVARKGSAVQSSVVSPQSAELAIDGNKDFSLRSTSCATTYEDGAPWWRLDLPDAYKINTLIVTYREDCFPGDLTKIQVLFGSSLQNNGNDNPNCVALKGDVASSTISYSCDNRLGQYLLIRKWWEFLSVCEVEIGDVIVDLIVSFRLSYMKIWFSSTVNLSDPTVTGNVLKELTSVLAVKGITNVTLSWTKNPEKEVIQTQLKYNKC